MGLGRGSESRAGRLFVQCLPGTGLRVCRFSHLDPRGAGSPGLKRGPGADIFLKNTANDSKCCWSLGTAKLVQPPQLTDVNVGPERVNVYLRVTQ